MKKLILLAVCALGALVATQAQMTVATGFNNYVGVLDTLTNTDTTNYTITIPGSHRTVTWTWKQTKISGTVTQALRIYGMLPDGSLTSAAVDSVIGSVNQTWTYNLRWTNNPFQKYKVVILSSGTQQYSQRLHLLYRND